MCRINSPEVPEHLVALYGLYRCTHGGHLTAPVDLAMEKSLPPAVITQISLPQITNGVPIILQASECPIKVHYLIAPEEVPSDFEYLTSKDRSNDLGAGIYEMPFDVRKHPDCHGYNDCGDWAMFGMVAVYKRVVEVAPRKTAEVARTELLMYHRNRADNWARGKFATRERVAPYDHTNVPPKVPFNGEMVSIFHFLMAQSGKLDAKE